MTRKTRVTMPKDDKIVYEVLRATNGNVLQSAKRLAVTIPTFYNWLNADPERRVGLQAARDNYDDLVLDQAVSTTMTNLKKPDGRVSNAAARTVFQFMGKRRGYVPASHVESDNHQDVEVRVIRGSDSEER